ncbi:MAG: hypothetical protein LBI06_06045 [Treponema sp.]|nr:hypothetical protein [Treponema sp.]
MIKVNAFALRRYNAARIGKMPHHNTGTGRQGEGGGVAKTFWCSPPEQTRD